MLRHVMVCLQPEAPGGACVASAVRLAAGCRSFLSGLYVREPPPSLVPVVIDPMVPTFPSAEMLRAQEQLVASHETTQDQLQAAALDAFTAECRRACVRNETSVRCGAVTGEVLAGARTADLVVLGRGRRETSTLGSVAGWLVRHLAQPVLLIGEQPLRLGRIGVAWDGSHGAQRALSVAAEISMRWNQGPPSIELIQARRMPEKDAAAPDGSLAEAAHYLDIYELPHRAYHATGEAADVIVEHAERLDVDLLVMGAYGHSLVREVLLGSTTQNVIARWQRPLLVWR